MALTEVARVDEFVPLHGGERRRAELSSFLRSRRERVSPQEAGLIPGPRRRTPGLRREEVAQLAGVGVSWYTWLEQGRPINASIQVLDAIARVLRLGSAERWYLYRLAEVPGVPGGAARASLPEDVPRVLDALEPSLAAVYDGKYDLLACNDAYAAVFPHLVHAEGMERNALWQICTQGDDGPVLSWDIAPHMVAYTRAQYARHLDDPEWTDFIEALSARSPAFARLWKSHNVSEALPQIKSFRCFEDGVLRCRTQSFDLPNSPGDRMIVYLPMSDHDRGLVELMRSRRAARAAAARGGRPGSAGS